MGIRGLMDQVSFLRGAYTGENGGRGMGVTGELRGRGGVPV